MSSVATLRRARGDAIRRLAFRLGVVGLLLSYFIFPQSTLWQHVGAASVTAADWLRHQTVVLLGGTPRSKHAATEFDLDKLSPVNGYPASEIRCLALAMYHEAGNERPDAQLAIAQAALNRAVSFKRPKAVCRAIYTGLNTPAGCLFEASCRNIGSTPPPGKALAATVALAVEVAAGRAAAKPAFEKVTHFHASSVAPPPWTRPLHRIGRLGRIDFYTPEAPEQTAVVETSSSGATTSNTPQQPRPHRLVAPPRRPQPNAERAGSDLANQAFGQ